MKLYKQNVNGVQLQVADYLGDKGAIIAIHGLTGTYKNMHYYAEKFRGDYRFIAVDLRGRGNSASPDHESSIFKHADDIIGLIEALKIESPILIGHSMGAFISAIVASKLKSIRGIILLDGAAEMSDRQLSIIKSSLNKFGKKYNSKQQYINEVKMTYAKLGIIWNDIMQDIVDYEVEQQGNHWENKSDQDIILADLKSLYSFKPEQIGAKIGCPVLLVYAEGKIGSMPPLFYLSDYDKTLQAIKQIDVMISNCNHYTMVFENREDINEAIEQFLTKIS